MYLRILVALLIGAATPVSADTIRAGGMGGASRLLPLLFFEFAKNENVELNLIPSLGSGGGLRALAENFLDLAVSGRPLNEEEIKSGMTVALKVRSPFVLVTSHVSPNGLKRTEIADIFSSEKPIWADGAAIRVILRPKSDSDTPTWIALFPGMAAALEAARKRPDVTTAATDQDNADAAERLNGSLTGSTLTQINTEERNLRFVEVDGVSPSLNALEDGTYPYSKTLLFVLPARPKPAVERFMIFLRSAAGQALLRRTGNIMVPDKT